ncbi:transmembrane emp24 domain-containing protein 7 [Plakobranchus ocellatus]|uniref:Transmembrane emp24 domain-containing protein 7 n=1 Tax=Plakobranchus ocellatus TaxID=259542 RepID=A0AAV4B9W4_9GAST|nr:transmembrane emp24 domain-containing protein 7 [Plakobranchus ocellatus]
MLSTPAAIEQGRVESAHSALGSSGPFLMPGLQRLATRPASAAARRSNHCEMLIWLLRGTFGERVKIVFEFQVTAGGNRDIDTRVMSPNGMVIYKALRTSGEELSFNAQGGDFRFCFSNEFSKFTSKRVAFNIRPFDEGETSALGSNGTLSKAKGPVETHCDNIYFLLEAVQDFQAKYVVQESAGRYLAEVLQVRVTYCALILSLVVLVAGLGQVAVFKRFFTEKRVSTKPESDSEQVDM